MTFHNGDKYVGELKDGKRHGQGTFTSTDGSKYVGEYKDGKKNGQGTNTWSSGDKYVGEWKDGKKHGQGTKTWSNGDKYEGEYKDGKENGQGTLTFFDGKKWIGEWKKGEKWNSIGLDEKRNIIGERVNGVEVFSKKKKKVLFFLYVNKKLGWFENFEEGHFGKYLGETENGEPNGMGRLKTRTGLRYVGQWKDGKISGLGIQINSNGENYVGEFRDGNEWNGTLYDKDGKYKWKYVKGVRVK